VVDVPEQIVVDPLIVTDGVGTTVTDEFVEIASEQMLPASRTTAWYKVVPIVVDALIDDVVFAIVVQVVPLLIEDSQRTITPVFPVKLMVAPPVTQIKLEDADVVPPKAGVITVTSTGVLITSEQTPLFQRTLYHVVV